MRQPQANSVSYRVPAICPGGTVVCLGGGPSLTPEDVEYVRDRACVIAVNDAYRLARWADALMASDAAWWAVHRGVPTFHGLKFCLEPKGAIWPGVVVLRNTGDSGIDLDPTALRTGRNSGAAAIGLAVHFGAARILLLGYDCQRGPKGKAHWFGSHTRPLRDTPESSFQMFRDLFAQMTEPLSTLGITVLNCSRQSAITAFPRAELREVLP